jgi:hypothetical protein
VVLLVGLMTGGKAKQPYHTPSLLPICIHLLITGLISRRIPNSFVDIPATCALYVVVLLSESVKVSDEVREKIGPCTVLPATVTLTFPVDVPTGTVATIEVSLQLTMLAAAPHRRANSHYDIGVLWPRHVVGIAQI